MKYLIPYITFVFILLSNTGFSQSITLPKPPGSVSFGTYLTVLPNGNYVVSDPDFGEAGLTKIGAVYLYDGSTNAIISILKGSSINEQVGGIGVTVLSNGNFVILSPNWNNGTYGGVGAATWASAVTGVSGTANSSNSIVGSHPFTNGFNEAVGRGCIPLTNGNYVIISDHWFGNRGAVTWGNGTTGTSGVVSSSNSIVGTTLGDRVGYNNPYFQPSRGVIALSNGNYVVSSSAWNNGSIVGAGAVTWGDGSVGTTGIVSASNSIVGSHTNDQVGTSTIPLTNGNYVTHTKFWDNTGAVDAGAVTWGNGTVGTFGVVGNGNSITGLTANDNVGGVLGVTALTNGNYVVASPFYNNGVAIDAGAITWGNGATGTFGPVLYNNSLMGTNIGDKIGSTSQIYSERGAVTALSNGNYVVASSYWKNGSIAGAGAATWCNGSAAVVGDVTTANSLVGSKTSDNVGSIITALTNGNYVVGSQNWDNGAMLNVGAATWCNGTSGRVGIVSNTNSLIGAKANDSVSCAGITPLANGNYVVRSSHWDNGTTVNAGAATWGDGTIGITGIVSIANSLVGSQTSDGVSGEYESQYTEFFYNKNIGVIALTNGNYAVISTAWNSAKGAVTFGNGSNGTIGQVSFSNSLVGSAFNDSYNSSLEAAENGNYIINNYSWDNGSVVDAGAVTFGNGSTGVSGFITSCNSVIGSTAGPSNAKAVYNSVYNEMIVGSRNAITIFNQSTLSLGNNLDNANINVYGNTPVPIISSNCKLIANITANGASPIASSIAAKVWIETTQPTDFVKRHIEITPATNPTTATARVTLYALQTEFDDFNAVNTVKLPTSPTDVAGIANLYVEKRAGSTSDGTGLPASYLMGSVININPNDADIVWNSTQTRWEISFDVTGFSGFFIKTATVLPLKLLSFTATLNNNDVLTTWLTTDEINTRNFEIERSINGINFYKIGELPAYNNSGNHTYNYTDKNIINLSTSTLFYRLKQIDNDGKFTYSEIKNVKIVKENAVAIYPTPTINNIKIVTKRNIDFIQLYDLQGKKIKEWSGTKTDLDVHNILSGVYILNIYFKSGEMVNQKILKQ